MAELTIQIEVDSSPLMAALSAFQLEAGTDRAQLFLDGLLDLSELARVHVDSSAASRAGRCLVVLEPSDLLAEFVSAVRAGEGDRLVVERESHGNSSDGDSLCGNTILSSLEIPPS